ncbi:MAG: DUF4172 domain-containing protein [Nitrospira sp.]|nr:DUF4172 domain-containing protein [Nitrospira sp.]
MPYNWQQPNWPEFRYDLSEIEEVCSSLPKNQVGPAGSSRGSRPTRRWRRPSK